jgi:phenylpropionate dioxygenase-like ring-hydroxylating dioxygenase large terminal subunit
MSYLRNTWYAVAHSHEVTETPMRRVILDEAIVFYRVGSGAPAALFDRCPHRFAPLSKGKLIGDELQCIYHGLQFDRWGACVLNPHGNKAIPQAARVRSYPLEERYGYVWLWAGEAERADPTLIPKIDFLDDPKFTSIQGYLAVDANYQLVVDNLLDLSHVEYLHPMFTRKEGVDSHKTEFFSEGDAVFANRLKPNSSVTALARMSWADAPEKGDGRANMRWTPPSVLTFDLGVTGVGAPIEEGLCTPAVHLLTPETSLTTHYFWSQARNMKLDDRDLTERLRIALNRVFVEEDKPIVEAQQQEMGNETDIMALHPVLLNPDIPATRARRILARLIEEESAAAARTTSLAS